jgi:uncharacterized membrane protein HdeD (DUF308 family)
MPPPGEVAALGTAVCWTCSSLAFERATRRLGSLVVNLLRVSIAFVLLALIAIWAIFTGVAEIVVAVRLRKVLTGEWMMILAGLLAVAFGLILVLAPGAGALALVMWIGAYAVLSGALLIGLGLRLRTWGREHGAMPHPA